MLNVSPFDLVPLVGPTADFIKNEILRVGAPLAELKLAIAFVGADTSFDPRAYEALTPRLRRLVDLVGVAGTKLAASICEKAEAKADAEAPANAA